MIGLVKYLPLYRYNTIMSFYLSQFKKDDMPILIYTYNLQIIRQVVDTSGIL